jgi:uncharacterized membrane protein YdjX (TVP38/TMEM64 family)
MKDKRKALISLIMLAFIVSIIVLLCVALIPILADIFQDQDGRSAIEIIHSHGVRGIPVLALLQALQVITTVVPALLIQIPAGLVFGTWNGLIICLAGSVIGNMMVFVALRQFSTTLDNIFPKRRNRKKRGDDSAAQENAPKKRKLPFFLNPESLNRMPHPEIVAFYVYLIPGIPNGVLPHIFARTKVSFARYLIAVIAGNAPSTLVCTLVGDRLAHGDFFGAVIIILIFSACIGIALLLRRKLITLISGGYSLSLGSANNKGKGAESAQAPKSEKAPIEDTQEKTTPADGYTPQAQEKNPALTPAINADVTSGASPETPADTTSNTNPEATAETPKSEQTADVGTSATAASGTDNISPHGWRIIKGRKN